MDTIDDQPGVRTIAASRTNCKNGIEPFPSAGDSITKGKKLSVYRADFPRTLALVVALFPTVTATSAFAREFRAADTQSRDHPTVQALSYMDHLIEERPGGRLQIRVFHSRQLGEEKETIEQTRIGAIWQSLPPEDGKLFREAAQESSRFMREKRRNLEDRSRQQAEAAGITIIRDFDRKPFEAAMDGVCERVPRDPAAARLIERISQVE